MFRVGTPPIIRSTYNCNYSIWYWSNRLCYLPLSWKGWNISTIAEGSRAGLTSTRYCNYSVFAPDDGCGVTTRNMYSSLQKYNKTYMVACWSIIEIDSRCTDPWTQKNICLFVSIARDWRTYVTGYLVLFIKYWRSHCWYIGHNTRQPNATNSSLANPTNSRSKNKSFYVFWYISSYICHGAGPLVDPFRSHVWYIYIYIYISVGRGRFTDDAINRRL